MLKGYKTTDSFDEMYDPVQGIRQEYQLLTEHLEKIPPKKLLQLQHATDRAQMQMGMTFNVYGDEQGEERILHMDIIPRVIGGKEWEKLERGLEQRIRALNLFVEDLYHDQKILKDRVIPKELVFSSECYLKQCEGLNPPSKIWSHISGIDLIRGVDGEFYILEDNLRCPSGVSYMLENREILKKTFPEVFAALGVRPVYDYALKLLDMLQSLSEKDNPTVVLLTPGIYNSAYFEHSYLAREMGIELVEGRDLVVQGEYVWMHTTRGLEKVDVIYRRIDDTFLDPLAFDPDSILGVSGLFEVYTKGNVALANAPGTGVADDKAIYPYVPALIKYYLGEEITIPNVTTFMCSKDDDRQYVLDNIEELVVKETNSAGGYGMMIGPKSSKKEHQLFREKVKDNPRKYIAQPTISLSSVPTICDKDIEPRHVDLRPYILFGNKIEVVPGALTRVALRKGSLVVNSSQGGGSKDTWVLYD